MMLGCLVRLRILALSLLILPYATLPGVAQEPAEPQPEPGPEHRLTVEPYVFEPADGDQVAAELGKLTVAETRRDPESRTIEVAFVRLPSLSEHPGAPILYLAGGPGSSGIDAARGARWALFQALRQVADVILLDPRGTGLSRPNLICRQTWIHPYDQPLRPEQVRTTILERARACAETLKKWGYRISAYNAREIADDVEEVRRALGVPKLDLLATSYGSHLALAVLRRHESSVGRAVLVGVVGPDQALKLPGRVQTEIEEIGRSLEPPTADGESLAAIMRQVLDRLDREPRTVRVLDAAARRHVDLAVGKLDLQLATIRSLGNRAGLEKIAGAYREMEEGDFSTLAQDLRMGKKGWLGSAIPYAILCASGVSPERWKRIQREAGDTLLGRLADFPFPEICPAFGVETLPPELRTPVEARTPTLMISGTLDLRTPVENALEVKKGLPRSHHLVIEGAGHGDDLLLSSPKIVEVIREFLQGGEVSVERIAAFPAARPPVRSAEHGGGR